MSFFTFIRRFVLILAPILTALIGGLLWVTGTHHMIGNPYIYSTISQTSSWNERVSLLGRSISIDVNRETLERHLKSYGYTKYDDIPKYYNINEREVIWAKIVSGLPCEVEYSVILSFTKNNRILTADGVQNALGCL